MKSPSKPPAQHFAAAGLAQVLVVAYLLPWAFLAYCIAYLAAHPADWTGPVALGVPAAAAIVGLHVLSARVAKGIPLHYQRVFRIMLRTVQVVAPLGATTIGYLIFRSY